jgi:3,4-dihydroxy 2-butanone 4-phosphate synthase/GTP cyclohydrolase II
MNDVKQREGAVQAALEAYSQGSALVLVFKHKDKERGAILCAAERADAQMVNLMATHARGLVCVALTADRCSELGLELQARSGRKQIDQFTVSVEAKHGVTTGISVADRVATIAVCVDPGASANDLVCPGHVFPSQVHPSGVLSQPFAAEAAVDLARLSGSRLAAGVYTHVLSSRGDLANLVELNELAKSLNMPLLHVEALVRYRMARERLVRNIQSGTVPTAFGEFEISVWENLLNGNNHVLIQRGRANPPKGEPAPLVRVHSQCLTGDVFQSLRCDCGDQLTVAFDLINEEKDGAVLYLRQEGRGIGLINKLLAYGLQDRGRDTVEANVELGFKADQRDYGIGAQILQQAGYKRVRLLTNNPEKIRGVTEFGLQVVERVALIVPPNEDNLRYLSAKKQKLGHLLDSV